MYWLIGSLIISVMLGVLSVANPLIFSATSLFIPDTYASVLIYVLSGISLILIILSTRQRALTDKGSASSKPIYHLLYYTFTTALILLLVVGSALQVVSHYQQAETTKITDSMRVSALVTIEGVSDSVYDTQASSGYRQVATISHHAPQVTQMTAAELNADLVDIHNTDDSVYKVLLSAYPKSSNESLNRLNDLRPGDQLFMSLTLAPLATSEQAMNNPSGFDSYRWLRARHIDGVATINQVGMPIANITEPSALNIEPSALNIEPSALTTQQSPSYLTVFRTRIDQVRWQLRQHFYHNWGTQTEAEQQAKAVTLSLLTGDRSLINRSTKDLYQLAGISHLLAISGTHVLFLAIVMAGLATFVFDRRLPVLYRYVPRWQVRWQVMIVAAFIYALFTGFDVPAARTAWTLLAIGVVRLTLLPLSTVRVLLGLAIVMAWVDPFVLWQAGYWLSFIAVALLLKYESAYGLQNKTVSRSLQTNSPQALKGKKTAQWLSAFKRLFKLQCWLFVALLPVTLLLFGKASLWGLVINLFAIGLFGWVIVPLNLLAGLCYLVAPVIADMIWALVSTLVASLHTSILWLTSLPTLFDAWVYTPVNAAILLMAFLVLLPWLLPRGLISRVLAVPPLTLLVMSVYANQQTLVQLPTLYILPTGDRYLSAAVLRYPATDQSVSSWLFLADHMSQTRTRANTLSAQQLSKSLEQQLGTLSVKRLDGIVVQTALSASNNQKSSTQTTNIESTDILLKTVFELVQRIPVSQYWQAGRHDLWQDKQRAYQFKSGTDKSITAQRCHAGKTWQMADSELAITALTGWSEIDDASVWDCAIALDSGMPIQVVKYNPTDPLQSPLLSDNKHSRIVLDAATHNRVWQMWSLLCDIKPFTADQEVTWLSHSRSQVTGEVLAQHRVAQTHTYNGILLPAALALDDDP
ncbi:ComEC/Rec2 family competence protein [Psychrobacter sp. DM8]|uniref:ComEC/Rec2 family competence protein n=1 Tax=Psychrobacter sp. DM8 TaxID=3440636 RepID=UPI003F4FD579